MGQRGQDVCGLWRMAYVSSRAVELSRAALGHLVSQSRVNNRRDGLTGILLVGRSGYAQLLEGAAAMVRNRIAAITRDPRHHDVRIFLDESASQRLFAEWYLQTLDEPIAPHELARAMPAGAPPDVTARFLAVLAG